MKPNPALTAARTLCGFGYACFPCGLHKRPCTPNGFKDATNDREAVDALWAQYPGELVGVACGTMSGIAVLDIDRKHEEARGWWLENRERLLPARVHRTRSGGLHCIYQHREGLACSTSRIARGVDVRAEGGYVIWWPAAGLPVLADAGIQPWPEWLMPVLNPPAPPLPVSQRALAVRDPRPAMHRTIGIVRAVAEASDGQRNRVLFWAACRCRDMVAAGELNHDAGIQVLQALRAAAAHAGLPEREIDRTITSAMRVAAA